jgi:TusA-related sulfurtransferase
MEEGDILSLTFDNPSSKETIIQMVEAQGDEILEEKIEGGKIYLEIEKG